MCDSVQTQTATLCRYCRQEIEDISLNPAYPAWIIRGTTLATYRCSGSPNRWHEPAVAT